MSTKVEVEIREDVFESQGKKITYLKLVLPNVQTLNGSIDIDLGPIKKYQKQYLKDYLKLLRKEK